MPSAQFSDLKQASVYITGGGSGIGAAITEGFVAQGAKVAFIGRSDATAFANDLAEKYDNPPLFIQGDITDIGALQASMAQAKDAHGPITCLINNAANDARHSTADVKKIFGTRWCKSISKPTSLPAKPPYRRCKPPALAQS